MKKTIVVNLLGGPGVGKSTTMASIFAYLKRKDIDCEQVTEFAKDLVWEDRKETFKDELYIFAKQAHRLFRVNDKVDVIVTDRPLILTAFYAKDNKLLCDLCKQEFDRYYNLNYLITRTKKYNPNGRNQTEAEAKAIDSETEKILNEMNIKFSKVAYEDYEQICKDVESLL